MLKATNANRMKERNKKMVLDLIRRMEVSRADIAHMTGLTKAAVTFIVEDLLTDRVVCEAPAETVGVGRPSINLYINRQAFFAVGVDITRNGFEVGIVSISGDVLTHQRFDFNQMSPTCVLEKIAVVIKEQLSETGIKDDKVLGIGVSTPGPVNYKTATIINPPNFEQWHDVKIGEILHGLTGFDIKLENISNASALAEKYFGVAKKVGNFVTVLVNEGIGSGFVINDTIFRGAKGFGNELGHTSIKFDGKTCECGNLGCLEKYASMKSLLKEGVSWRDVVDGNEIEVIQLEAFYLSVALVNAVNLFDLDMIVLTGDICYKPDLLISFLYEHIRKKIITQNDIIIKPTSINSKPLIAATKIIYDFFNLN